MLWMDWSCSLKIKEPTQMPNCLKFTVWDLKIKERKLLSEVILLGLRNSPGSNNMANDVLRVCVPRGVFANDEISAGRIQSLLL
jgi:hypothetical protein